MPSPADELLARKFRVLMFAILFTIVLNVAAIFLPRNNPAAMYGLYAASLLALILNVVCVVGVGNAMQWGIPAIVFSCLAMILPFINLIALLVINSGAVKRLKAAGYRVGIMGAKGV